jgi:hypothetical protein
VLRYYDAARDSVVSLSDNDLREAFATTDVNLDLLQVTLRAARDLRREVVNKDGSGLSIQQSIFRTYGFSVLEGEKQLLLAEVIVSELESRGLLFDQNARERLSRRAIAIRQLLACLG